MKRYQQEFAEDRVGFDKISSSINSWISHAAYADSSRLREKLLPSFVFTRRGRAEIEPGFARRFLEQ